jgi:signal transduction histidine kinase
VELTRRVDQRLERTLRVTGLVVVHVLVTASLMALAIADAGRLGSLDHVVMLTAFFGLVGLLPMHLELGRSACTFTLVEAALVIALFTVGPLGVVVAAVAGEAIACLSHRQAPIKVIYNASSTAVAAAVAALTFTTLGGPTAHVATGYACALAATAAFALCDHASTSLVLAATGEGRFEDVFTMSAPLAALASAVSGTIGLALKALSLQGWAAPLLLVPVVVVVAMETQRAAAHRAERLRFERLYTASARTTGLQGFGAALAQAATEARSLVTGSAAVCCALDRDGQWRGMLVDDAGSRPADPRTVTAVVALSEHAAGREVLIEGLPKPMRSGLPAGAAAVVAGSNAGLTAVPNSDPAPTPAPIPSASAVADQPGAIALAVFRERGLDDQSTARAQALWAFMFHAALITTNAALFERVEEALRHQVDLNRQKDEFLAAVSHELRTPLASMLGSVETLRRLEGRMEPEAKEKFFGIAHRQGRRLQRLIEELLLTAAVEHRQEAVVAEPVEIGDLLDEVAEDLGAQAHGRIVVEHTPGATRATTDPSKLRQVLTNLVENATKYAPNGLIEVSAAPALGQRIEVRVVDHGPGVAIEDRTRVFERFVQLDGSSTRAQGGTGLGLYLCQRVAELLEADLILSDTPGGGATFTLNLPRAHSTAFTIPTTRAPAEVRP